MMDGVARHHRGADNKSRFFTYDTFFRQAADGTLPQFSWVAPSGNMSDRKCRYKAEPLAISRTFLLN
eukprot:SAG31_NODE_6206_length_2122_cov_1.416708_3_plen_67_part_00